MPESITERAIAEKEGRLFIDAKKLIESVGLIIEERANGDYQIQLGDYVVLEEAVEFDIFALAIAIEQTRKTDQSNKDNNAIY